ncbi:MAG: acyl carrier protein [Firmicutes bacterium]|nr:acyl carrier protein [Bacillota bacterium]
MVQERIIAIIAEKLDIAAESISGVSTFDDLHIDSLDLVEIMLAIEDEYDITIEEASGLETVADVTEYVQKKIV